MLQREYLRLTIHRTNCFDDIATWVLVCMFEFAMVLYVFFVVLGIGNGVERAADDSLRFGLFGHHDSF